MIFDCIHTGIFTRFIGSIVTEVSHKIESKNRILFLSFGKTGVSLIYDLNAVIASLTVIPSCISEDIL